MSGFAKDPTNTLLPFFTKLQEPAIKGEFCQKHGLTPLGETLMQEMMLRGMLIDVAHLPRRGLVRAYELLTANDYPALKTHGDSNDGKLYELGGLGGMRFQTCGDPNNPKVMAAPLAEAVALAKSKGAYPSEGLKFDLNGFAGGPLPRFGPNKTCGDDQTKPVTYPFTSLDGNVTFEQPWLGQRKVDFNTEGMLHIGLLPELLQDVRLDGATTRTSSRCSARPKRSCVCGRRPKRGPRRWRSRLSRSCLPLDLQTANGVGCRQQPTRRRSWSESWQARRPSTRNASPPSCAPSSLSLRPPRRQPRQGPRPTPTASPTLKPKPTPRL